MLYLEDIISDVNLGWGHRGFCNILELLRSTIWLGTKYIHQQCAPMRDASIARDFTNH